MGNNGIYIVFIIVLASVFVICAFWSRNIASRAGRSELFYFLIGLLLGPFGVLAALLLKPLQRVESLNVDISLGMARQQKRLMVNCPECGLENSPHVSYCVHCNAEMPRYIATRE